MEEVKEVVTEEVTEETTEEVVDLGVEMPDGEVIEEKEGEENGTNN